jgi:hypothetical protein
MLWHIETGMVRAFSLSEDGRHLLVVDKEAYLCLLVLSIVW